MNNRQDTKCEQKKEVVINPEMNMILSEEIDRIAKQIVDSAYNVHVKLDAGLRIDMIVEEKIIVELKSVEKILPVHTA